MESHVKVYLTVHITHDFALEEDRGKMKLNEPGRQTQEKHNTWQ